MSSFFPISLNSSALNEIVNNVLCFVSGFTTTNLLINHEENSNFSLAILEKLSDLKVYLSILIVNFFLIFFVWNVYSKRITDQFMKPATLIAIEELKASVSKLKLPKEHSPRI